MCAMILESAPKFLRLMWVTTYMQYSTDVTVAFPATKIWSPSQAVSSRVCACGGWATVRIPHSSRMVNQRKLTTLELAGETQHKILLDIITLYGRYWLLLGSNRKLIDLLCRNNIVAGSTWAKPQKEISPSKLPFLCHCLKRILMILWNQIQS